MKTIKILVSWGLIICILGVVAVCVAVIFKWSTNLFIYANGVVLFGVIFILVTLFVHDIRNDVSFFDMFPDYRNHKVNGFYLLGFVLLMLGIVLSIVSGFDEPVLPLWLKLTLLVMVGAGASLMVPLTFLFLRKFRVNKRGITGTC